MSALRPLLTASFVTVALVGCIIKKEVVFVQGRDFQLDSGRIRLKNSAGIAGFKSGEPLVGPYSESVELGLDQRGHGKYKQQFSTAGLVYLFLPIAMSGTDEVRFLKIKNGR